MSIDTTLSVPIFNVLKYFAMSIFLEAVVRTSLDRVNVFFRALDLHHGRAVALNRSRIDRYNLCSIIRFHHLPRLFFTIFLSCCAYSVEILLEFSSTAEENEFPVSGVLEMYEPTHRACTPLQLEKDNTMTLVYDMASSCVTLTEKGYTFYNVSWQRQNKSDPIPVCVHTRNNVLHEGGRIYREITSVNNSRENEVFAYLFQTIRASSWQSNGNSSRYAIILRLTDADVKSTSLYAVDGQPFTRAIVVSQAENETFSCVGTVFGKHGAGIMSSRVYGCFGNFSNGLHYIEMDATSIVEADAEFMDTRPWSTLVATRTTQTKADFTRGVVDSGDLERIHAYTMLLSAGPGKDIDTMNKYAVVYKHCSDFLVPQYTDIARVQNFNKAYSVRKITIIVYGWGLVTLITWPIFLSSISLGFFYWGKRKGLPVKLHGEGDIGRRWLSRCSEKNPATKPELHQKQGSKNFPWRWFKWDAQSSKVFMNVKEGETEDDIVVGAKALSVNRNTSHAFTIIN